MFTTYLAIVGVRLEPMTAQHAPYGQLPNITRVEGVAESARYVTPVVYCAHSE